jgi:outer membrane receptor protein involved in Fe transport
MWNSGFLRMTLGSRYEMNSLVGNAFVPRAVLTKILDPVHFKLLASTSFRAPSVENIDTNANIKPERTTVYEFESGYQFSKELFFTANIFDITIKNPIIYTGASSNYNNRDQTGSRGFELEVKHVDRNHHTTLNYSFYSTSGKNKVSEYEVPGRDDALLGLPQQKWTLNSNNRIWHDLYFNPSVIYLGSRYGYAYSGQPSPVYTDSSSPQSAVLTQFSGVWLFNAYFHYKDLGLKDLSLGIGVFNLLNQTYDYIQPYYTAGLAHAPLPAPSREWVVNLGYHYGF